MVDYGQDPDKIYYTETRLDEPVAILGIKIENLFSVGFGTILSLTILGSVHFAFAFFLSSMLFFKACANAEERGVPITHRPFIYKLSNYFPKCIKQGLMPSLAGIRTPSSNYRRSC